MFGFIKRNLLKTILFLLALIAGFVTYQFFFSPKKSQKTEFTRVKRGILEEKMTISGKIDADEHVLLKFQTSGYLNWVGVKEGDHVKKFQTLASLDQTELKKQLQKNLNDYLTSRWNFDDTTKNNDWSQKFVTDNTMQRDIDRAQFDLNNSVLDVELKDLSLKYANPLDSD
jgi:multidrug efflux pump subunit AcrA (membrane-fusion protein)